ncbi:MAG: NAD-dependent epimerase/dehydratase family protein [Alphaproteobacteria bacterium]|nr:NAD-dependent epimerase/dehydratase family protein [Alphaproteobacteria bacterium]NCQ88004.1 NAD-dependent epimerase/dehydratase family protein [Alphaproteobacteria bacterium]NCT05489.1 NAD-dependent epimerase/dehydratase family protein [Alphaproteobacteria bacterium]
MTILVIGQSSYIARALQDNHKTNDWSFIDYREWGNSPQWKKNPSCVINLALDSTVREGYYSDLDLRIGQKAQGQGSHFIAISSRAVYGEPDKGRMSRFKEDMPLTSKTSKYGQAKRLVEKSLIEGLSNEMLTILRPSNIFGMEYNALHPRKTFFGHMLHDLKHHNEITFDMAGSTRRDFMPVAYFVDILADIATKPNGSIYNIGAGFGLYCGDMAHWIIEGYGAGMLKEQSKDIKDSFEMDITHLSDHYKIIPVTKEVLKENCIEIGKTLAAI